MDSRTGGGKLWTHRHHVFRETDLVADKVGDSPIKLEMKLGTLKHFGPSPNLKGPHNWSQNRAKWR